MRRTLAVCGLLVACGLGVVAAASAASDANKATPKAAAAKKATPFLLGVEDNAQILGNAEAVLPDGAIRPDEVPVLSSVGRRIEARFRMLQLRGLSGYFWTRRLQRAQIDLALERWHRARKEIDSPLEAELKLRDRVLAIRRGG